MEDDDISDVKLIEIKNFNTHRLLVQNVNGDDKMAIKWVMDNGFLPEDEVEQCPDCQIEFNKGNRTVIRKLKYYKIVPGQRRKGIICINIY